MEMSPRGIKFILPVVLACFWINNVSSWSLNKILLTGPKAYQTFSESVARGARKGLVECRFQFRWDRWNCPDISVPLSMDTFAQANRETSYVHAIVSAGVMFVLTQNCSLGAYDKCSCDISRNGQKGGPNWKWGGCSDNIMFGAQISRQFVDHLESGNDARAAMSLHNNEVGRRAVRKTMKMTCKCHGVSGSCTTKTCWQQLADFRKVGDYIRRKYLKAIQVAYHDGQLQLGNTASRGHLSPSIASTDLVYLEESPDYCKANLTTGTEGTVGRECVRPKKKSKGSKWERRSCKRLCKACGLNVRKRLVEVKTSCNCKFHWCCSVKCEQCVRKVYKFRCAK